MKKLNYFFSLLLFLVGGVGVVQAQTYNAGDEYTDTPAAGESVFLYSAVGSGAYYCGEGNGVTSVTDDCLMQFEATGETVDGHPVFLLKQVSTGLYLKDYISLLVSQGLDTSDIGVSVGMTSNKAEALRMTVLRGAVNDNSDPRTFTQSKYDGTSINGDQNFDDKANVFVLADASSNAQIAQYYFGFYGNAPFQSPYTDTNAWYIYHAVKASVNESLNKALETYFPNGVSAEEYPEGTDPGQYTKAAIDAAKAVYNRAMGKASDENLTEAEATALVEELKKAKEDLTAAAAPMRAGTYFILGHGRNTDAIYDYTYPLKAQGNNLIYTSGYNIPEKLTIEDAPYIFEVTATANGRYTIKSFSDGRYVGAVKTDAEGGKTNLVATPEAEYEIAQQEFTEGNVKYKAFYIALNGDKGGHSFHQANSDGRICGYTSTAFAGAFRFASVSEESLAGLRSEVEKQILINKVEDALQTASAIYNRGRVYKAVNDTHEENGWYHFDDLGIVSDASQINSNSIATNEGEKGGSPAFVLDGMGDTYYHSVWSGAKVEPELAIDLGEPYQDLVLQMAKRNANKNHLSQFQLLASNDSVNWSDEGVYTVSYNQNGLLSGWTANTDSVKNLVALTGFSLSQPFRYLRLLCTGTTDSEYNNGYRMFHMAELRVYEGEFDAEASTAFNSVTPEVRQALLDAMAAAKAALAAGTATQKNLDDLVAATEAFSAQYPMPEKLTEAINSLKTYLGALPFVADEAQAIGNFPVSVKNSLTEQADGLTETTDMNSATAINAAVKQVEDMKASVASHIKMPEAGKLYFLRGATTATAANSGMNAPLYAQNNDENSGIRFMPRKNGTGTEDVAAADSIEDMQYRYNYIWMVEKADQATQTLVLRNLGTGMYIKNDMTTGSSMLTTVPTPGTIKMISFCNNSKPAVSFVVGEKDGAPLYANTTPGGGIVTYHIAGNYEDPNLGDANSSFTFQEVLGLNDDNATYWPVAKNALQIVTLPFAATVFSDGATFYEVLGLNAADNTLELNEGGEELTVEAGQGFIVKTDEVQEGLMLVLQDEGVPAYSFKGINKGGVTGNVLRTTVDGAGIRALSFYSNGNSWFVRPFGNNTVFGGNSGYLHGLTMTTEKGSFSVALTDPDFITGIESITAPAAQDGKIYDLSGRRVQQAQKGLYIINGKKVLVK